MCSSSISARSLPRYRRIHEAALRDGISAVARAEGLTPTRIRQIVTRYRQHVARQQDQANARRQYQDNLREAPVGVVLELPARTERALRTAGIRTIDDLIRHSPDDLLRHVRNLGRKSLRVLVTALGPLGLSLRKRSAPPRRPPVC